MATAALKKRIKDNLKWVKDNPDRFDLDVIKDSIDVASYAVRSEKDIKIAMDFCNVIKKGMIDKWLSRQGYNFWDTEHASQIEGVRPKIIEYGYKVYKLEAPFKFESYLFYLERKRKYEKRFYVPRRGTLKVVVDDMQRLENDELDVYGLSMPARVGKSATGIFFLSWVGYRKPWSHSAAGGHSGVLAKRIFKGYCNIVETTDYTFTELFKDLHPEWKKPVEKISSDPSELTINLGDPDEFATMSCRGIDASWTGVIDISDDGYLYVDDLVRDREHSLSATRMENTYQEYQNKMIDRMNNSAKRMLVGTLWGVSDPLERERKLNEGNPRALFRKIPALDENDKSNFRYEYHGFSSSYYIDKMNRLDRAEWMAKYQQEPFVREGLLFPIEQLRTFDGLVPDRQKKVVAAIDPAFGRGDYLSMPICFDYGGNEKYIVDWVYDNRTQNYTVPEIVDKIEELFIMEVRIEKNSGGDLMADNIEKELESRGIGHCVITRKSAPVKMSKEDKISAYAPFVLRNFIFLSTNKTKDLNVYFVASEQYRKAIDALVTYSPEGKNAHDDAPDGIAQLAMLFEGRTRKRAKIVKSPV